MQMDVNSNEPNAFFPIGEGRSAQGRRNWPTGVKVLSKVKLSDTNTPSSLVSLASHLNHQVSPSWWTLPSGQFDRALWLPFRSYCTAAFLDGPPNFGDWNS